MKNHMTQLHKVIPFFLLFLITFSVQGQPPPPGYNREEMVTSTQSAAATKEFSSFKGPNNGESSDHLKVNTLDEIYKTFLNLGDNLKLFNSEVAKDNANDLVMLLNQDIEQSLDDALFDQIKANAKLICATDDLDEQKYYFSMMSENMHKLLRIK